MHRIFFLDAFSTVAAILRPPVGDEEKEAGTGILVRELLRGVANGWPHARSVERRDSVDAAGYLFGEFLVEVFDHVELYVLAPVTRETVDAVVVAEGFQSVDQEDHTFFLDINDAFVGLSKAFGSA